MSNEAGELIRKIQGASNYYEILGVERDATEAQIKKAYRKLALVLHPDKCKLPGAEECFKSLSTAYSCLSNQSSRQSYDVTGSEPSAGSGHNFHGVDPNEIFEEFFRQYSAGGGGAGGSFQNGRVFHFTTFPSHGGSGGGNPFVGASFGGNPFGGAGAGAPTSLIPPFLEPFLPYLSLIPWKLLIPLLLIMAMYLFSFLVRFIFTRLYLLVILYITPRQYKMKVFGMAVILSIFGIL